MGLVTEPDTLRMGNGFSLCASMMPGLVAFDVLLVVVVQYIVSAISAKANT